MISFLKRTLLSAAIILILSLSVSHESKAGMPVFDGANLMELIYGNLQELQSFYEELEALYKQMEQYTELTGMQIDAENNAMANQIAREGLREETLSKLASKKEFKPDPSACDVMYAAYLSERSSCAIETSVADASKAYDQKNLVREESNNNYQERVKAKISKIASDCNKALESGDASCVNASLLSRGSLSNTAGVAYTPEEELIVENQIELLIGPIPERWKNPSLKTDGYLSDKEDLEFQRKYLLKRLARESLMEAYALKKPNDAGVSLLDTLDEFNQEHYLNSGWMAKQFNVHPGKVENPDEYLAPISEVQRNIGSMMAYLTYLETLKYKQQVRMELLMSAGLALELEGIK